MSIFFKCYSRFSFLRGWQVCSKHVVNFPQAAILSLQFHMFYWSACLVLCRNFAIISCPDPGEFSSNLPDIVFVQGLKVGELAILMSCNGNKINANVARFTEFYENPSMQVVILQKFCKHVHASMSK